jgi:hypothetical protein
MRFAAVAAIALFAIVGFHGTSHGDDAPAEPVESSDQLTPPPIDEPVAISLVERFYELHNLPSAQRVRISESWNGLNVEAPFGYSYDLERRDLRFEGLMTYWVAGGRREEQMREQQVWVAAPAIMYLLNELPRVPAVEQSYSAPVVLDAYTFVEVLALLDGNVFRAYSSSPMHNNIPWALEYKGRKFVTESPEIGEARERLEGWLRNRNLAELREEFRQSQQTP